MCHEYRQRQEFRLIDSIKPNVNLGQPTVSGKSTLPRVVLLFVVVGFLACFFGRVEWEIVEQILEGFLKKISGISEVNNFRT